MQGFTRLTGRTSCRGVIYFDITQELPVLIKEPGDHTTGLQVLVLMVWADSLLLLLVDTAVVPGETCKQKQHPAAG